MKEILIQQGFGLQFPDEVIEETLRITDFISKDELALRKDMREILTFTIDPEDAKDFDDAISIEKKGKGIWEIGVHIADVSQFICPTECYPCYPKEFPMNSALFAPMKIN